jgi:hypothetical protein
MSADFDDLSRELEGLGADTRHVSLPGPAAARRRAHQRARNQAVAAVLGGVAIVAGAVIAFAQPTLISAPDFASTPTDSPSPDNTLPTAKPTPPDVPALPTSVLLTVEDLDQEAGWVETEPPAEVWPCAPEPPSGEQALRRSFDYPGGNGRIDQIVEPTADAAARMAAVRNTVTSCVSDGDGFDLDQVWSVTGVGVETVLIRYWAPPREKPPGEGRLLVSISLARSGDAVTSVTHGGFTTEANTADTTAHAEAAAARLCAVTGGECVTEPTHYLQVFPDPDVLGWLTVADVVEATAAEEITAVSTVLDVPEGSFGFVCFESNSIDAGAGQVDRRTYYDALDPGSQSVDEIIASFPPDQEAAARSHYDALVAEAETCAAEPSVVVENLGTVGNAEAGFVGTAWRATAPETDTVFHFGVVVKGAQVAFVNASLSSPTEDQLRALLTRAASQLRPSQGSSG